jgi:DNA-binding response OmpR family regulator
MAYQACMAKRILFVDDDAEWREMVSSGLKEAGYNVLAVRDAGEALLQTEEDDIGLIILDLDLGGENGLMLMKFLKRNHPSVPIILYTGMEHEPEAIERMQLLGANQYLRKGPLSELLRAIQTLISE